MTKPTDMANDKDQEASRMREFIEEHSQPLLYVTVHGSRLYGFDTPNSDRDLRGAHVQPIEQILGLEEGPETITRRDQSQANGIEMVTHEAKKLFKLVLNRNGNSLEQVLSPLILVTGEFHAELREIAGQCITSRHASHYMGMARQARSMLERNDWTEIKFALHLYRAFLTGIHLMETGELECNLPALNAQAQLSFVDELLERRAGGSEEPGLGEGEANFLAREFDRLTLALQEASDRSALPAQHQGSRTLNDLLVRIRRSESLR